MNAASIPEQLPTITDHGHAAAMKQLLEITDHGRAAAMKQLLEITDLGRAAAMKHLFEITDDDDWDAEVQRFHKQWQEAVARGA